MIKSMYLKLFSDYLRFAILVSFLELHYQIIKNSLCVNFYYNNYNLAPTTILTTSPIRPLTYLS